MLFLLLFFIKSSFTSDEDDLTSVLYEIRQLRKEVQELKKIIQKRQEISDHSNKLHRHKSNETSNFFPFMGGFGSIGFGDWSSKGRSHSEIPRSA
ncbi:hypothetical protein TVAG_307960 [Trichomonas vaginalis G3]|uniref:Uncharacterized protein n=1 Tax=Trichomonas vaginalis (strain ATCC PRA-98 / G3) TaxID=412133 RepID=A2EGJ5_TRIV3|nr:hypothetical protein TVAGG3_0539990 [Trichomonas vaginalis G3]EAY08190.1 hypothetical protein TVAG_307960 [Trichomonas vaginalis G3]KAI5519767.1 hypothetical protein TVAGG3_0539990 [Trichomonas vaginalis G3]|eukprot:XP_001320413.1 hypothetical protein [Trichomonas vaginalis G3]